MPNQHLGNIVAEYNGIKVLDCAVCGYAHQHPLPAVEEVEKYYQDDSFYATHSPPQWFVDNAAEHTAGLWRQQYDRQQDMLGGPWQTLVDIGAGDGWFLKRWQERSGHGVGVEPSKTARQYAPHSITIYPDYATLVQRRGYTDFDQCSRAALVLEHVSDPWSFMQDMGRITGKYGRCMIAVPNEFNPLQNKIRRQLGYDWFVQKPHLNYFTKDSIAKGMHRWGFRVVKQTGTFPMELLWLMGYKYIGDAKVGAQCHRFRLNFEAKFGRLAFKLYDYWYKWFGWGRETIIVGERK